VPAQSDPKVAKLEWQATRLQGQDPLAVRVSRKLRNDGLLALQYGSTLLRQDLDRIPLWRGNHVALKRVIEDFVQYLYLQRLRDTEVLLNAIRDGVNLMTWPTDSFAYAEGWDEGRKRYVGLQAGRLVAVSRDSTGLLVKPDVAEAQMKAEAPPPVSAPSPGSGQAPPAIPSGETPGGSSPTAAAPKPPTRFYGSI